MLASAVHFLGHALGNNRQSDKLRVSMFQRGAGGIAMVFEDQDVFEAAILLEVNDAVTIGPKHIFHLPGWKGGQGKFMFWRFDDDLVRANSVHLVVKPFALPIQ